MKPKNIIKIIEEENSQALFVPGFDQALIGTCRVGKKQVAAYDMDLFLRIFIDTFDIDESDVLSSLKSFFSQILTGNENDPVFLNNFKNTRDCDDLLDSVF